MLLVAAGGALSRLGALAAQGFHLPGGDGAVIMGAGVWARSCSSGGCSTSRSPDAECRRAVGHLRRRWPSPSRSRRRARACAPRTGPSRRTRPPTNRLGDARSRVERSPPAPARARRRSPRCCATRPGWEGEPPEAPTRAADARPKPPPDEGIFVAYEAEIERQQQRGDEDQPDARCDQRARAVDVAGHADQEAERHQRDERRRRGREAGTSVQNESRTWSPGAVTSRLLVDDVAAGLRCRRLPAGRVDRARLLPGRPARQAGARRGSRRVSARPSWRRRSPRYLGRTLVRLQCYEGLDEAKALYEWNYRKQLLRIQAEARGHRLGRRAGRHLRRGVPARAPADDGDRFRPSRSSC